MLNITSIKRKKEPKLKTYKMVIAFKPNMLKTDYILCYYVVQGVTLEYACLHDCSLIPEESLSSFFEVSLTFDSIGYTFKADLAVLKDLEKHIRILCYGVDFVTICPLDAEEN
nr:MAG TPA: hypothetical protein [Bacteriophage sp.]